MEAAGRKRELAGEVGDLVTSVNPAMARGAMPWWGEQMDIGGVFVEEPQETIRSYKTTKEPTHAGRAYGYFRLIPDKNPENFEKYQESY